MIDPALNIQLLRWEDCFTLIDVLKYTKTKCVDKIVWIQILTSEKCTVFLEEWMAVKLFSNIYSTSQKTLSWNQLFWKQAYYCLQNYSNNGWLQVLPSNFYLCICLFIYLFIYLFFMILGASFILALSISISNPCKLWPWILKEPSFARTSSNVELWSWYTIDKTVSWMRFIWLLNFRLWNIQTTEA